MTRLYRILDREEIEILHEQYKQLTRLNRESHVARHEPNLLAKLTEERTKIEAESARHICEAD